MRTEQDRRSDFLHRHEGRMLHVQAALWSAGNALTSGTPIYFLAMELGGKNTEVGVLLAIPTLLGLLRLAAPAVIARCGGDLRRACLILFGVSYLVAATIPLIAIAPARDGISPLVPLIAALCLHQTIEYLGLVALYSWIGELVPTQARGSYLGARQFWQLALEIPTILLSGVFIDRWAASHPGSKPAGYAIAFAIGVALLFASVGALLVIPSGRGRRSHDAMIEPRPEGTLWQRIAAPFRDPNFRRLLWYGCWFSTFNGLTASPQSTYPKKSLGLGVGDINAMRSAMRVGQFALSRPVGLCCDRFGTRTVLIVSQLCVAAAPLCFLVATPSSWAWIAVAYLLWSWYVGLNVGLPTIRWGRPARRKAPEPNGSVGLPNL